MSEQTRVDLSLIGVDATTQKGMRPYWDGRQFTMRDPKSQNEVPEAGKDTSPAGFYGSNVAQEGFVGSSAAPFNFGQQSFFGSSTPAPFNTFSADLASSELKSASIGSASLDSVAIGGASLKANNFDVVKK